MILIQPSSNWSKYIWYSVVTYDSTLFAMSFSCTRYCRSIPIYLVSPSTFVSSLKHNTVTVAEYLLIVIYKCFPISLVSHVLRCTLVSNCVPESVRLSIDLIGTSRQLGSIERRRAEEAVEIGVCQQVPPQHDIKPHDTTEQHRWRQRYRW